MTTSQEAAKLKNPKIEIPSCLFRPLAHLGSYKRWFLSTGVTNLPYLLTVNTYVELNKSCPRISEATDKTTVVQQ